jgi:predicted amidohydrolase
MKVAAYQIPECHRDLDRAVGIVAARTRHVEREGVDLVCFPECFLQGYSVVPEHVADVALDVATYEFRNVLRRLEDLAPVIVVGFLEREGHAFYNSAAVVERGRLVVCYRKTHLLKGERAAFEPGDAYPVFDVAGTGVGVNICCDLNFDESIRGAVNAGAELLACPCNNMMRNDLAQEWKLRHNEIRSARAREAAVWLVSSDVVGASDGRVSYGPTAVIDPNGTVVCQVPLTTIGVIVADIREGRAGREPASLNLCAGTSR